MVGGLYPSFVQTVQVNPNELNVERQYLRNHLEATRAAFGLDEDLMRYRVVGDIDWDNDTVVATISQLLGGG